MTSTAAAAVVSREPARTRVAMHRIATFIVAAEILMAVTLVVALAVIGAADAAGLDVLVPAPGPMPAPSVAPPGLDL